LVIRSEKKDEASCTSLGMNQTEQGSRQKNDNREWSVEGTQCERPKACLALVCGKHSTFVLT
jgi:hypothetical protein